MRIINPRAHFFGYTFECLRIPSNAFVYLRIPSYTFECLHMPSYIANLRVLAPQTPRSALPSGLPWGTDSPPPGQKSPGKRIIRRPPEGTEPRGGLGPTQERRAYYWRHRHGYRTGGDAVHPTTPVAGTRTSTPLACLRMAFVASELRVLWPTCYS
jgi:hypothetical protein